MLLSAITLHRMDVNVLANCSIYLGFRSMNLQTPQGKRLGKYRYHKWPAQKNSSNSLQRSWSPHSLESSTEWVNLQQAGVYIYSYLLPPSTACPSLPVVMTWKFQVEVGKNEIDFHGQLWKELQDTFVKGGKKRKSCRIICIMRSHLKIKLYV